MATPPALKRNNNKQKPITRATSMLCLKCGEKVDVKNLYTSKSPFYTAYMKIPFCKDCLDDMYQEYYKQYKGEGYTNPERKAIERVCMITDIYYKDSIFESAQKSYEKAPEVPLIMYYIRITRLVAYQKKTYDDTIREKYDKSKDNEAIISIYNDDDKELDNRVREGQKLFGSGFEREDYIFLYNEYADWTSRHECDTKSKEELIKQICFVQLDLFKANRAGKDTKDLNRTLTTLMDAAKLQPKQNSGDTTAQNQTLGTLIDKWENTRPIPECDEELKDVDHIARYINIFFKGHLSKMMGLKNGFSNMYNKFMEKYTVTKPEYNADEDDEALFEAVFGSSDLDSDKDDILDNYHIGDEDG